MSCLIDNNITAPCNRSNGGIRRIYLANGPIYRKSYNLSGQISRLLEYDASNPYPEFPNLNIFGPWYTIELPRVTGTFDEVYEINQANGTVVYNQELRFVTNTHDSATRARIIEMAQSTDMVAIFEDNNGKQWLLEDVFMRSGTTETGVNYSDRNGHNIVLASMSQIPAEEVNPNAFGGPTVGPINTQTLYGSSYVYQVRASSLAEYIELTDVDSRSGWRTNYDTVAAYRQFSNTNGNRKSISIWFTAETPALGMQGYYDAISAPWHNYPVAETGRGFFDTIEFGSGTNNIVDFVNGQITRSVPYTDYVCSAPRAHTVGQPFYRAYYGYNFGGSDTIWTTANPAVTGYTDTKALIEAMPAGATPLYYEILRPIGSVAKQGPYQIFFGSLYDKEGFEYEFPQQRFQIYNYTSGNRGDMPQERGYLFNTTNHFDGTIVDTEANWLFEIGPLNPAFDTAYCPDETSALQVNSIILWEAV